MSRPASSERAASPWRAWEKEYREKGRLYRGIRLDPHTARVLASRPELAGVRWLDAGCGDGKGLVALVGVLTGTALPPVGLDASRWALRRTREALALRPGAVRAVLVRGDVRAPPLAANSFGAVRAVHVLGHLRAVDRPVALRALARLLDPDGVMVMSEFGTGDFRLGKGIEVEPRTFRRGSGIETHYFERDELVGLAAECGMRVMGIGAEEFTVEYGGEPLPRQRWDLVAARAD